MPGHRSCCQRLAPLKLGFAWSHAKDQKGRGAHPRRLITSCSRLARAPREHTAASHPVRHDGANPTRAGCRYALDSEIPLLAFVGRIPRTGFAGCCGRPSCVCLRQTFRGFFSHSAFAVVFCSLSLISTLSRRTSECMNLFPPCSVNVKFLVHQLFYFEFDNVILTSTKII